MLEQTKNGFMGWKNIVIIFLSAIFITIGSYTIAENTSLIMCGQGNITRWRGMPIHFIEHCGENLFPLSNSHPVFLWAQFFVSLFIWCLIIFFITTPIKLQKPLRARQYMKILVFGTFLLFLNVFQTNHCFSGYPTTIYQSCSQNQLSWQLLLFMLLDLLFWTAVGSAILLSFNTIQKQTSGAARVFTLAAFFDTVSLLYNRPCRGELCILTGRGFPLPALDKDWGMDKWGLLFFIINFVIILIFVFIIKKIFNKINQIEATIKK